jgi:hypothetical protein
MNSQCTYICARPLTKGYILIPSLIFKHHWDKRHILMCAVQVSVLDSLPDLDMLAYLPQLLDGLVNLLIVVCCAGVCAGQCAGPGHAEIS